EAERWSVEGRGAEATVVGVICHGISPVSWVWRAAIGGSGLPECPLKIKFSSFARELLSTADRTEKYGL
ncbi:MAG TPA: hypothetical protein VHS13_06490, partial [Edaphobacter sp.]|nr:hypothetical protein [Edaphobacter sp.]